MSDGFNKSVDLIATSYYIPQIKCDENTVETVSKYFAEANRKCQIALCTSDLSSKETEKVQVNYKNKKRSKEMLQYKLKYTELDYNDKFSDPSNFVSTLNLSHIDLAKRLIKLTTYKFILTLSYTQVDSLDSDDSACHPGTGVSGDQAVGESSTAHVVSFGVHDHGATKDVVGTDQRDEGVREREFRHPRVVRLDVA
ncbi:hypothetical protein AGLY_017477 [Aphis glycines]|uniref:Uncharacterized protein n=1 Tax=Aphis glycines TaxID=307491 RepID=A0A6G0SUU5_APHGL|nr:hypothetical protein AGLY_017477 [Aphis glycines]